MADKRKTSTKSRGTKLQMLKLAVTSCRHRLVRSHWSDTKCQLKNKSVTTAARCSCSLSFVLSIMRVFPPRFIQTCTATLTLSTNCSTEALTNVVSYVWPDITELCICVQRNQRQRLPLTVPWLQTPHVVKTGEALMRALRWWTCLAGDYVVPLKRMSCSWFAPRRRVATLLHTLYLLLKKKKDVRVRKKRCRCFHRLLSC